MPVVGVGVRVADVVVSRGDDKEGAFGVVEGCCVGEHAGGAGDALGVVPPAGEPLGEVFFGEAGGVCFTSDAVVERVGQAHRSVIGLNSVHLTARRGHCAAGVLWGGVGVCVLLPICRHVGVLLCACVCRLETQSEYRCRRSEGSGNAESEPEAWSAG
jgi:hypothetical protein